MTRKTELQRRMDRLQMIADFGANPAAYVEQLKQRADGIPDPKEDHAAYLVAVYRLLQNSPRMTWGDYDIDVALFLADRAVRVNATTEEVDKVMESVRPRRDALWVKYGWPELDDNGDPYDPFVALGEDNVPDDVAAFFAEIDAPIGEAMDRDELAAFIRYGFDDIPKWRDREPEEFRRRIEAGRKKWEAIRGPLAD
jgi:hypothetical protein